MTRKDYELINKVISGLRGEVKNTQCPVKLLVCENFVTHLETANANFNPDKFRKACGVSPVQPQFEEQGHTSSPCGL